MKYPVGDVQSDDDGFGFNVTFDTGPERFVTFSFEDHATAKAMATKMKEIVEVCVSLKAH